MFPSRFLACCPPLLTGMLVSERAVVCFWGAQYCLFQMSFLSARSWDKDTAPQLCHFAEGCGKETFHFWVVIWISEGECSHSAPLGVQSDAQVVTSRLSFVCLGADSS